MEVAAYIPDVSADGVVLERRLQLNKQKSDMETNDSRTIAVDCWPTKDQEA